MKPWTYFCVAVALVLGSSHALAAAYKCTTPGGGIVYSDTPCPTTATKGEKLLGRGAGTNPLTDEEKAGFKAGILSQCNAPRNVCECVGDYLADNLTYEEVMQASRNRGSTSPDVQEKTKRAMAQCRTPASK
jgi:hypothetical protein